MEKYNFKVFTNTIGLSLAVEIATPLEDKVKIIPRGDHLIFEYADKDSAKGALSYIMANVPKELKMEDIFVCK